MVQDVVEFHTEIQNKWRLCNRLHRSNNSSYWALTWHDGNMKLWQRMQRSKNWYWFTDILIMVIYCFIQCLNICTEWFNTRWRRTCICLDIRLVADNLHHIMAVFLWLLYNFHCNVLKGDYRTVTEKRVSMFEDLEWLSSLNGLRLLSSLALQGY